MKKVAIKTDVPRKKIDGPIPADSVLYHLLERVARGVAKRLLEDGQSNHPNEGISHPDQVNP